MNHKSLRATGGFLAASILGLLASWPALSAHGRTNGLAGVSNGGQATYSIPLFTPPGTNGMTPSLSLNYSSGGGEGSFGFGWSLGGLTGISRCASTWEQDGAVLNVRNTTIDKFCIDGNKLRLQSGSYGQAGSTYRTELESYSRITAFGAAGFGPSYFVVEAKNGLIYEYGNSEDSRIQSVGQSTVRFWAVSKIRDRSGNAILFNYTEDAANGSFRISTIQYTQNLTLGVSPTYTVTFSYNTIPLGEVDADYLAGSIIKRITRATSIDVTRGSNLIRRYILSYEPNLSSASKSRLQSIQECAGAGPDCLAPTTFVYQNGTPGLGTEVSSGVTVTAANSMPLDVNGDGRTDLVYSSVPTSGSGVWMVMFANSSGGYNSPVNTGITNTNFSQAIPIDYNSDGLEDFLVPYSGGTWWAVLGTTSGLASPINTSIAATGAGGNARAMDINGDGRDDLVFAIVTGSTHSVQARLRDAGGTFGAASYLYGPLSNPYSIVGPVFGTSQFTSRHHNPDFNGDGLADFIVHSREYDPGIGYIHTWEIVRSGGLGVIYIGNFDTTGGPYWPDLNGDGCSDTVYTRSSMWRYRFSNCIGLGPEFTGPAVGSMVQTQAAVFDWDGDGFQDIVGRNQSTNRWEYIRSTGDSLGAKIDSGVTASTAGVVHVGDVNGDGLDELIFGSTSNVRLHFTHAGVRPDLLLTATDGFGEFTTFTYTTPVQGSYTKGSGNGLGFPYVDWQGPMPVVASKLSSNGIGGSFTTNYTYYGAMAHLQGRGMAGFWKMREVDTRNGVIRDRTFDQQFPRTGALKAMDVLQPSGSPKMSEISVTNTPFLIDSTSNNQRHVIYPSTVVAKRFDVSTNPSYNGNLISTATTANQFDAATGTIYDSTVTTTEPASGANGVSAGGSWVSRTYMPLANLLNDTSNWCLGRPGRTQQINFHNLTLGTQITRTTDISWDVSLCRPTQTVEEPGDGTLQVTTSIGYDSFGNVNSTTVTGIGMAARTTSAVYSDATYTTGQFPLSVTNALSQTSTNAWNYDFGVPSSATDPNGISTSWLYDAFGRRTRENRPDGTATTWSVNNCTAVSGGCVGASNKTIVIETALNTSSGYVNDVWTYLDMFDRPIITTTRVGSGSYNRVDREFDALGRVYRESAPCIWSGCATYWVTNSYDLANRPTQSSRPISDSNSTPQYSYIYYEGLTTRAVDAQSKQSVKIANAFGQLARSTDHDGYYQAFDYDAFGAAKRVLDSAGNTLQSSTYNLRGMLTARTDMDMGSWSFTPNALGEVVSQVDAKSQSTGFSFDLLGRLTARSEAEGTSTWTWGISSASKNIGRLASMSGPGYSESYTFDGIGRPSTTTISADVSYQIDYSYNNIGALDTLTYPTSTSSYRLKLQYEYQYGQLYRVRDFNSPYTNFWTANTFNGRNQITQETLGNGLVTNRTHDGVTGWLRAIQTGSGGGSGIQNLAYEWDLVGNLKKRRDVNQSNLTEEFFYDNLYRLDYSQLNGGTNLDLSYSALGNITYKSDVGNYSYHATKKHQLTSTSNGWSFGHDNNGNMTSGRGASITWTSYNYPASIANGSDTASFSYTPDRKYWRQISNYTSGGAATSIYVGGILEKVTASGNSDYRHMIRAGGSTVIVSRQTSGTNSVYYLTRDHLGSSSAITNSSGGVLVNSSFDAFGKRRGSNWTGNPSSGDWTAIASTTRRGYTDHTMLDNLNLIHMNGRMQDPVLGRFASADPFITEPLMTQNYNRYSYVYNNALSAIDPSGFGKDTKCTNCIQPEEAMEEILVEGLRHDITPLGDVLIDALMRASSAGGGQGENEGEDLEEVVVTADKKKKEKPKEAKRTPMQQCMQDRMGALGWAIDGAVDSLPLVDGGIGAQDFASDLTNDAFVVAGSLAVAHVGSTAATDGVTFAERVGGRVARGVRILTGGRNYRQMRSAVRTGRSFGRTVPVVALGIAVFTAFYSGTSFAVCALE